MIKTAFISCFYNPADFKTPVENCNNFMKYTVDKAFPAQDFYFCQVISEYCRRVNKENIKGKYIELKSESVLWHKERCLNLLARKFNLYDNYDYICWVDSDVIFEKPVTINSAHKVSQPFNIAHRAKKAGNLDKPFSIEAFIYDSFCSIPNGDRGLSWAIKADLLKKVGGWFDYGIVGGGDTYFIRRMLGQECSIGCKEFDVELANYFKDNTVESISSSENKAFHMFHGQPNNRQYDERIGILRKYNFSPLDDLIVEKTGLYRLKDKYFEADIKRFFIDRDEDVNKL